MIKLQTGTKFCMIDCGGGTVDITSHLIASGGADSQQEGPLSLNELTPPLGGNWGSLKIDENFLSMLIEPLLGAVLYSRLCTLHSVKHQLMEEFEIKIKKPHSGKSRAFRRLNISILDSVFEGKKSMVIQPKFSRFILVLG